MTTPRPTSEMVATFREAVLPSFALLGAVQLNLFTVLKDGPAVIFVAPSNRNRLPMRAHYLIRRTRFRDSSCPWRYLLRRRRRDGAH